MTTLRTRCKGQPLGTRALTRRARILTGLDTTMLATPWRWLTVSAVAHDAGCSPGVFYQYFPDIEAAVVALAGQQGDGIPEHVLRVLRLIADEGYPGARDALLALAARTTT